MKRIENQLSLNYKRKKRTNSYYYKNNNYKTNEKFNLNIYEQLILIIYILYQNSSKFELSNWIFDFLFKKIYIYFKQI